jgi:glucose/arabinose dehydrogenase/PKD repeat protein
VLRRIFSSKTLAAVVAIAALSVPSAATGAVLPQGFTDSLVASVPAPSALAFTPDGRLLITSQTGALRVVQDGTLLGTPALDFGSGICSDNERGLLGIVADPAFAANHFIYLYYTAATASGCMNRVSRFVLSNDNVVDPSSESILINIPSPGGFHNGGDVHFGKDGYLYVSVGDGTLGGRDPSVLLGKILRVTSDGGIPADNPFLGADSARCNLTGRTDPGKICQETYSWGLRNPFRIAFDPNASGARFYINDVGQNTWEEIDLGQAGADYGWNVREGFCAMGSTTDCGSPPAGMTNPIYAYPHADGCTAITGGAFVPNGIWPDAYNGSYLFADYLCGTIFQLVPSGSGTFNATTFASGFGSGGPITMMFGPSGPMQGLYYTTYVGGGQVRRIDFTEPEQNHAPMAAIAADLTSGAPPLTVKFDGSASSDPDSADTLTYIWDFGDDATPSETTTATVTHVYSTAGTFTATLTVRDNHGATSTPATVQIQVATANRTPTAVITATVPSGPAPVTVTFDGSASSDPDAGDTLTYIWGFGDGSASSETTTATVNHLYLGAGTFTATLSVRDDHGATSAPATVRVEIAAALIVPENLAEPAIVGVTRVENTLTASTGTWRGSEPVEFSYQWLRCDAQGNDCEAILEATATEAKYMLSPADFGSSIRVTVMATNGAGTAVATSDPTPRIKHECSADHCTD